MSVTSQWVDRWYEQGIMGLLEPTLTGRETIYNDVEAQRLKELVDEEPHQLKRAQSILEQETGKKASLYTLKRMLKKTEI